MTKRLLAIALVVLVAVSCVYLPSVVASAAEGDVIIANKDLYEKNLTEVTFEIGQYQTEKEKVPAGVLADEAKLLKWAQDNKADLGIYEDTDVISVTAVEGKENTFKVGTQKYVEVMFQGYKTGEGMTDLLKNTVKVAAGSSVNDFIKEEGSKVNVPAFPGMVFTGNWKAFGQGTLDANGDGLVDYNVSLVNIKADYAPLSYGVNAYYYAVSGSVAANINNDMINGNNINYDDEGEVELNESNPVYYNALGNSGNTGEVFGNTKGIRIPFGQNPYNYSPKAVAGSVAYAYNPELNIANVDNIVDRATTYVFNSWKQVARTNDGDLQFVATYKKADAPKDYKYRFNTDDDKEFEFEFTKDELTVDANEIINNDVKKAIADYEKANPSKRFKEWKLTAKGTNAIEFEAVYETVYDYTVYYFDEAGFVTKKVVKFASDAEALVQPAPEVAEGKTFVKWELDANNSKIVKVVNARYIDEADESVLPEAKDGAASFKMAETLAADYFGEGGKATVGKTISLKVTGATATFGEENVAAVNDAIDVEFKAIAGCTVEADGNAATVTLTEEGNAYVVATVTYQGESFTKTFTVTGIK